MQHATAQYGRRNVAILATLALTVTGSALAAGAVHTRAMLAVSALASLGFIVAGGHVRATRVAWVLFALAGVCVVQALPLPRGLVAAVAPNVADVWQRTLSLVGRQDSWLTLSLAPGASWVEALKFASYALVVALAAGLAARHGPWHGIALVACSGVVVATVTLAGRFSGSESLLGLYRPRFAEHAAPIMNPNTLSGYLNLATFACFALLIRAELRSNMVLIGAAATLTLGTTLLLASRGGVLSFLVGALILCIAIIRPRARDDAPGFEERRGVFPLVVIGGVAAMAMVFLILGASARTWSELSSQSAVKFRLFAWTLALIGDHPWLGVGRGAFETAFPPYRPTDPHLYTQNMIFTHPENVLLQWAAEWGLLVTALALLGFALAFRRKFLISRNPRASAAALIGVGVVVLQCLFDLGSEVPALAIAVCVVVGSLFSNASKPLEGREQSLLAWPNSMLGALPVALIAIVLWAAPTRATELRDALYQELREATPRDDAAQAELMVRLTRALQQYPGDPYLVLLGAHAWRGRNDGLAFRFAARALERDPNHGPAHLLVGELLWARGAKQQAMLQLRHAVAAWPSLEGTVAQRALSWSDDVDLIVRAAPEGKLGANLLSIAAGSARGALRAQLVARALERDPNHGAAHLQAASDAIDELHSEQCAGSLRSRCVASIDAHLEGAKRSSTRHSVETEARYRAALGDSTQALVLLTQACPAAPSPPLCWQSALPIAQTVSDKAAEEVLRSYVAASCSDAPLCAEAESWVGDHHARRGKWHLAMSHFQRALQQEPSAARWLKLAEAAEQAGAGQEAQVARDRARDFGAVP